MMITSGGMTHGQGITDSTLTQWVHALPRCVPICDALEQFTGVDTATSEHHKDLRPNTQSRANGDHVVFVQWLKAHPPFAGYEPDLLVSLSTGIGADASVNCDIAVELVAQQHHKWMIKSSQTSIYKETTIGEKCKTITVKGQSAVVNPSVLFNRITCVLNNNSEMRAFLAYELALQRHSLFKDGVMRKPV